MAVRTEQALPSWTNGTVTRRLVSVDHKSVGVLYLLTAAFFLLGLGIARLLSFIDFAHAPGDLLDDFATFQLLSMQATSALFLVGLPATLGLATYVVPLQIGARGMVHPRLNAAGYWLYLSGAALMLVSYASGDPGADSIAAPLSPTGRQVWLLGLVTVSAGVISTSLSLLQTIVTRRAPGMTTARTPLFTLAAGAYAIVLVFGLAIVGVAAAVFLIDDGSARSFFTYDAAETAAFYQTFSWFVGHPLTYALFLPIVGMVSEAVAVRGRWAAGARSLVLASIAAVAALTLLIGLYHLVADPLGGTLANGIPYAGFILVGALVPAAVAWILQLGPFRKPPDPIWLLTAAMLVLLVIGTVLGFALGFPGDYDTDSGSYHLVAEFEGTLGGTAILGLAVGVLYFFPKLSGRLFDEKAARGAATLLSVGMILTMLGQHIAGEGDLASFSSAAKTGSALALAGYVLVFLGGAAFLVGAVTSWRRGRRVGNDPWLADTLEWYTESPPPPGNFDRLPPIESERPLHDLRVRLARGRHG